MVEIRRSVKYPEADDSYRIGQRPKVRVSIVDYGVGNLHSIRKALEIAGARPVIESNVRNLLDAEVMVFPGVGAFDPAAKKLEPYREIILDRLNAGTPCLGVCIGTHILFEGSAEGTLPGIGFLQGKVEKLQTEKVPHIGWNQVKSEDAYLNGVESPYFYFAHSYRGKPTEDVVRGTTEYYEVFPSLIRKKNTVAVQFHPEKSGASGAIFLKNFIKFVEEKL